MSLSLRDQDEISNYADELKEIDNTRQNYWQELCDAIDETVDTFELFIKYAQKDRDFLGYPKNHELTNIISVLSLLKKAQKAANTRLEELNNIADDLRSNIRGLIPSGDCLFIDGESFNG